MSTLRTTGILVILLFSFSLAQVRLSGSFQTSVYSFERPDEVAQGNFYQALRLKIQPQNYLNFAVNSYFRVAKLGNQRWNERFYNLNADWRNARDNVQIRLGRQFVYQGVINGTLDGVMVAVKPAKKMRIGAFVGVETPFDREMRIVSTDSSALGGFLAYRFNRMLSVDLSYYQRSRNDLTVWNLAGAALHGELRPDFYYQVQLDHNLETKKLQGMRYRLNRYYDKWSLSGEYNFQRPRVFEDSYFRIFRQQQFQQFRGGVTYDLSPVQLGVQYLFTDYEIDETNQVILNAGNRWGLLGFVFQDGYAGENLGVYGDVRYDILPQLTVKLYSSYYNFQRQMVEISEDAVAFSGGLDYRPWPYLSLQAELQESNNTYYKNDLRGLFRMFYTFRR